MPRIPLAERIRDALKPAMESRGAPEVTTEEIGSTAEAAVTIERLKQENLDQMEIHALEMEMVAIEQDSEIITELENATQEVTELKADLEHYRETGGINMRDATHIQRQLRSLERRMGMKVIDMPALESFRGATTDRIALTVALEESSENFLTKIWNSIKNFFKRIWDKIMSWFGNSKDKNEKTVEKLHDLLTHIGDYGDIDLDKPEGFKKIIGEAEFRALGKNASVDALVTKISTQINNTEEFYDSSSDAMGDVLSIGNGLAAIVHADKLKNAGNIEDSKFNNDAITKLYKDVLVVGIDKGTKEGEQTFESKVLLSGKHITLKIKTDKDSVTRSTNVEDVEIPNGATELSEVKFPENSKIDNGKLKDVVTKALRVMRSSLVTIDNMQSAGKQAEKWLDISPTFHEDATDDTKKKIREVIDRVKDVLKLAINNPTLPLLNATFGAMNALAAEIEKKGKKKD